ncbi:hypothetical protein EV356DRAFT_242220 [Viridothelium virens]|uniref:Uncharacterized protein n=1 Tax=Viridothelium virens TaxID=1048519 RepID=A0A6A6H479_VIRVR|nr:hypothetical protein EV356DRAFT_242220 [Viridothelium virens]
MRAKNKLARPPNAFILSRQHLHPKVSKSQIQAYGGNQVIVTLDTAEYGSLDPMARISSLLPAIRSQHFSYSAPQYPVRGQHHQPTVGWAGKAM